MSGEARGLMGTFVGVLAIAGGACGAQTLAPVTGGAPDSSVAPFVAQQLPGNWYAFGDGVGPNANASGTDWEDSDCVAKGGFPMSECSQIASPTPGLPFPPTNPETNQRCTTGTAAEVLEKAGTTSPDYADLWGAGIGSNFAPIGDAGIPPVGTGFTSNQVGDAGMLPTYVDLSPYKGIEFDFSADVLPTKSMYVRFPFQGMHGGDSPYWMGATSPSSPLTGTTAAPQHVEIDWPEVAGPVYLIQEVPPVTPPAFDPTQVQGIQFQVFTNSNDPTPYSFCVANLALIEK